jgi:hypothetical protein
MASSFEEAKRATQVAADALAAKDAGIHRAAKTPVGRDASKENLNRVQRGGAWVP